LQAEFGWGALSVLSDQALPFPEGRHLPPTTFGYTIIFIFYFSGSRAGLAITQEWAFKIISSEPRIKIDLHPALLRSDVELANTLATGMLGRRRRLTKFHSFLTPIFDPTRFSPLFCFVPNPSSEP